MHNDLPHIKSERRLLFGILYRLFSLKLQLVAGILRGSPLISEVR